MSEPIESTEIALETNTNKKRRFDPHPLAEIINDYLQAIRSIGETAQLTLPHVESWLKDEMKATEKQIQKFIPAKPKKGEKIEVILDCARDFADFTKSIRKLQELSKNRAPKVLARSLFMQVFSEFDAFTGAILKCIYLKNDSLLKGISREISLTDLLEFEDLNAVKKSMLEREIDTFRRDSYIEQFISLEKKFGISLRKFKEWGEFVELSQRRNIFTHNGGMISNQYIQMCEREGYKFQSKPQLGDSLDFSQEYFARALRVISKVGLMLGYTLWSKVFPKEASDMHRQLNDTVYQCLHHKRWNFVAELEDFVLSEVMSKGVEELTLRIRTINVAIGQKFSGNTEASQILINSLDWSASYRDFRLAIAVLQDEYECAASLMQKIGRSGEIIEQADYHSWPLFTEFREHPEFYKAYEKVYGEPFYTNIAPGLNEVKLSATTSTVSEFVDVVELTKPEKPSRVPIRKRARKID